MWRWNERGRLKEKKPSEFPIFRVPIKKGSTLIYTSTKKKKNQKETNLTFLFLSNIISPSNLLRPV